LGSGVLRKQHLKPTNPGEQSFLFLLMEFQLVVVGGANVGKSALTMQFVSEHFVELYDPTIEDSYRKRIEVGEEVVILEVLDTASQEIYSCIREQYFRSGKGFICLYSVTDRQSFEEVHSFHQRIRVNSQAPIIVVGNKKDLEGQREVSSVEGQVVATRLSCLFFETSAKTRENVDECFMSCVKQILSIENSKKKEKKPNNNNNNNPKCNEKPSKKIRETKKKRNASSCRSSPVFNSVFFFRVSI